MNFLDIIFPNFLDVLSSAWARLEMSKGRLYRLDIVEQVSTWGQRQNPVSEIVIRMIDIVQEIDRYNNLHVFTDPRILTTNFPQDTVTVFWEATDFLRNVGAFQPD
jgi:hypothetical protein